MSSFPGEQKNKKQFLDFFPVPQFLLFSMTGITLSDKSVRFTEFKRGSRGLELKHSGEVMLPDGALVSGFIHDKDALIKVFADLRSQYGFRFIRATLPEEKAYLFTTTVDKVPFNDLRDAVAFTIEENVPVSLEKSVFDFEVIGDSAGKQEVRVAVAVLPLKVVSTYIEVFKAAGMIPVSFDIESQAIARAIVPKDDMRAHLIVNITDGRIGFYVVEDGVVEFSSTSVLNSVPTNGAADSRGIKIELRKMFTFWNTRLDKRGMPARKIEKVLLIGSGARDDALVSELTSGIDVECALGNVWENAFSFNEHLPGVPYEESLIYAGAIGAALPVKYIPYV